METNTLRKPSIWKFTQILILFLSLGSALFAADVSSLKDGAWEDPSMWSSGEVPRTSDRITITHQVTKAGTLWVDSPGSLVIEAGAGLQVASDVHNNYGTITVSGTLEVTNSIVNMGMITNNGGIVNGPKFKNTPNGVYELLGTHTVTSGNFENEGYWVHSGVLKLENGQLTNYGLLMGNNGHCEVCGDVDNGPVGNIIDVVTLCIKCGGNYTNTGSGDFVMQCTPFAMTLVEFYGGMTPEQTVLLNWTTASEQQSEYFVIERSTYASSAKLCQVGSCINSDQFIELGRVDAAGSSNTNLRYTFTDESPFQGLAFYRLKLINQDGSYEYSNITEVIWGDVASSLWVYPNPTNQLLTIRLTGNPGTNSNLRIFDMAGRLVWERKVALNSSEIRLELPVRRFSSGTYIVDYRVGDKKHSSKVIFYK